jgi:hypothetical protein
MSDANKPYSKLPDPFGDAHDKLTKQARAAQLLRESPGGPEKWVGHVIKKGFPCPPGAPAEQEFMYLEVLAVEPDGRLSAKLLNTPVYCALSWGQIESLEDGEIVALAE